MDREDSVMSCCLTPSTGPKEDFTAAVGCQVTLKVKGTGVALVHVRYAEKPVASDPPKFPIEKGANMLVIVAEGTKPGALIQLVEACDDATEQILDRFHYDPKNPARGYIVRGS
jgi:hypothetical protein